MECNWIRIRANGLRPTHNIRDLDIFNVDCVDIESVPSELVNDGIVLEVPQSVHSVHCTTSKGESH